MCYVSFLYVKSNYNVIKFMIMLKFLICDYRLLEKEIVCT